MADAEKKPVADDSDYELLPHKEIEDLRQELKKLKGFDAAPTKTLQVSLIELNKKIDKLIAIFEEAMHEVKTEEGGLSFKERMRPLIERMQKVLEQNSEIAEGIVTIGDMIKELKDSMMPGQARPMASPSPPLGQEQGYPGQLPRPAVLPAPPIAPIGPPPMLGPPPPRKRTFGL